MASKNTELRQEQEAKKKTERKHAFAEAIQAVEKEHKLKLIPMIEYTSQGLYPSLGVQEIKEAVDKV